MDAAGPRPLAMLLVCARTRTSKEQAEANLKFKYTEVREFQLNRGLNFALYFQESAVLRCRLLQEHWPCSQPWPLAHVSLQYSRLSFSTPCWVVTTHKHESCAHFIVGV